MGKKGYQSILQFVLQGISYQQFPTSTVIFIFLPLRVRKFICGPLLSIGHVADGIINECLDRVSFPRNRFEDLM